MPLTDDFLQPITPDIVPEVDNALAVGEDLNFQERWWKFERLVWIFFLLIIVADAIGLFGQGWLAHDRLQVPGSALDIKYDRIERETTPAQVTVRFGPEAAVGDTVKLFVSDSVIDDLGNQRIAPQPQTSAVGNGGVTFTFPYTGQPSSVLLSLEPSRPGIFHFTIAVPGHTPVTSRIIVLS